MNDLSHDPPTPYYSEPGRQCNREATVVTRVAVNSNHARGSFLLRSCDCSALPACTIYRLGDLRGLAYPIASNPSLVACRLSDLGNSHGANALALSVNTARELAGTKGGRRAVPGRIPPSLHRQAGLSGDFRNRVDGGWSRSLRLQLGDLRQTSVANPLSEPTADPGPVARILVVEVAFKESLLSRDHNHRHDADRGNKRHEQP